MTALDQRGDGLIDKGAHFFKCDFQVHTPRDLNWQGDGATTEEERAKYAEEFVVACRQRGLGAVAITDHHDIAFFPYIKNAATQETDESGSPLRPEQRLVVFPGMELTLSVPCQALLLLDADFPVELLDTLYTALAINSRTPKEEAKHGETTRLEIPSLQDLYNKLDRLDYLRGRYIVFPHVGKSGNFSLLRKGFASHYREMPCVGGYVDGTVKRLQRGNANIVNGLAKEYGNKAIGVFQTGDNRSRSFKDLGVATTWVKWSRPTAEALRQACLARHSRIAQDEPSLPSVWVSRIEVSNSKFLGPLHVSLNPQYNALIGGRGTGKSTLLEYLRWALCDQPVSDEVEGLPDFHQRRRSLLEKTLQPVNGTVQVEVIVDGTRHVVRRAVDGSVQLKVASGDFRPAKPEEIRSIIPIQAYSQKQLSSVGVKGDELRRFLTLPIQAELSSIASGLADTAARVRSVHDDLREQLRLNRELRGISLEIESVDKRLQQLRKGLTGLGDEDKTLIERQRLWTEEVAVIRGWKDEHESILRKVEDVLASVKSAPALNDPAAVANPETLEELRDQYKAQFEAVGALLQQASNTLSNDQILDALLAKLRGKHQLNGRKYEAAKVRAAANKTALIQITQLEARQRELHEKRSGLAAKIEELGTPEELLEQLLTRWVGLHEARTDLLQARCTALAEQSNGLLRASIHRGQRADEQFEMLKDLARGSHIRSYKFEALLDAVRSAVSPVEEWLTVVKELRTLSEADLEATLPSTPRLGNAQLSDQDRRKLAGRLANRGWADFAAAVLQDEPEFEYRSRESEFIDFADASAGQQATALMNVLLNQKGPPLIIDQPEDDLDNHVVSDIVEQVWHAKTHRQLLFASHNANLVVNGDAELVICFDYRTTGDQSLGLIKAQGAIDIEDVREEITAVMEGGRESFNLRKQKYGF